MSRYVFSLISPRASRSWSRSSSSSFRITTTSASALSNDAQACRQHATLAQDLLLQGLRDFGHHGNSVRVHLDPPQSGRRTRSYLYKRQNENGAPPPRDGIC